MGFILEVVSLRKRYSEKEVLRGVSFSLCRGEIFGLVGHNGAGKSTTLKIIAGFLKQTGGEVRLCGRVGFLPERPYFYTELTGREFLLLLNATREKDFWERVRLYGERLGIGWALEKRIGEYSKGMLQRFGILYTVLLGADLLLLDEPTAGLDPVGRELVINLMLELKSEGRAILFSTHVLSDVAKVCDRAGVLVRGELTDILEGEDIKSVERVFMERAQRLAPGEVL